MQKLPLNRCSLGLTALHIVKILFFVGMLVCLNLLNISPGNAAQPVTLTSTVYYSTYLGGDGADDGKGITIDKWGNIYVIGETESNNLLGSGHTLSGYSDIFVAKFNPAGNTLLYLTFIGSPDTDTPLSIQVDGAGNVYATGLVFDNNFPTKNALWPTPASYWQNSVLFITGRSSTVPIYRLMFTMPGTTWP